MWNIEYSFCQIYKPHTWFCLPNINHCETITSISISWSETAFNLQFHINTWAVVGSNEVQILHYCTWIEFLVNCTLSIFFLIIFLLLRHKVLHTNLYFLHFAFFKQPCSFRFKAFQGSYWLFCITACFQASKQFKPKCHTLCLQANHRWWRKLFEKQDTGCWG